jgi:excisionase family DNA binding protein
MRNSVHFEPQSGIVTPRLMKTKAAATYLGSSPWKVRKLVQDGRLSFISDSVTGSWRFDIRDLDRYIEANKRSY